MSISATMTVEDDSATPFLKQLSSGLQDRTRLNQFIAGRGEALTRDYLFAQAAIRHRTANALGATPTGHLERAAESVTSEWNGDDAIIGITSPGISRVMGDIEIDPVNGSYLTIPATAAAYGKRAEEVAQQFGDLHFVPFPNGKKALVAELGTGKDKQEIVMYWLVAHVTLPEDRTLLPSDEAYLAAAEDGAGDYYEAMVAGGLA